VIGAQNDSRNAGIPVGSAHTWLWAESRMGEDEGVATDHVLRVDGMLSSVKHRRALEAEILRRWLVLRVGGKYNAAGPDQN